MNKQISPKITALNFGILTIAFLAVFYVVAWTEPSQVPPGGNVAAPLNVGPAGQSKEGGLILNTGGAANGLIIDKGDLDVTSGAYKKGGAAGASAVCTASQVLKGATVSGGIVTGGSCAMDNNSGGTITGVTAGAGLTGGGTSGTVTLDLGTQVKNTRTTNSTLYLNIYGKLNGQILRCSAGQYVCGVGLVDAGDPNGGNSGGNGLLRIECCGK
ncbi:MAG: hypothetical protein HYV47_02360 [Candidatus Nealsonbacteria bacterium]|nr:hypothetical protein [Candidatus Nealsonbacteria bacterium]